MLPWTGPLLFADAVYACVSSRYIWYGGTLYGPFAPGVLAAIDIEEKKYAQMEYATWNEIGYSEDFSQWTVIGGASVASDTTEAPDGNTTADTLTFGAAAGDGIKIVLATAPVNDTIQPYSVLVKTPGTKGFRLQILKKDGATATSGDLTATTAWQRLDLSTVDVLAGATPVEARIINDSGGNAGDIIIWGAQFERYSSVSGLAATGYLPTSYIQNTTGNSKQRASDKLYWRSVDVPAAIISGTFAVDLRLPRPHTDYGTGYLLDLHNSDFVSFSGGKIKLARSVGTDPLSNALTWAKDVHLAGTFNHAEASVTVSGAASGNGKGPVLAAGAWTSNGELDLAAANNGRRHIHGLISQLYAP